jgi:hypothetical protein
MKVTRLLGLAAVGALLILAAPTERAQALSLANPGGAVAIQQDSKTVSTQVRWHGHWHRHWHRHR